MTFTPQPDTFRSSLLKSAEDAEFYAKRCREAARALVATAPKVVALKPSKTVYRARQTPEQIDAAIRKAIMAQPDGWRPNDIASAAKNMSTIYARVNMWLKAGALERHGLGYRLTRRDVVNG